MPDASKPVSTSITVTLNVGRSSERIATIPIEESEAAALGSVIARAVRLIADDWPRVAYTPQLEILARDLCKSQK